MHNKREASTSGCRKKREQATVPTPTNHQNRMTQRLSQVITLLHIDLVSAKKNHSKFAQNCRFWVSQRRTPCCGACSKQGACCAAVEHAATRSRSSEGSDEAGIVVSRGRMSEDDSRTHNHEVVEAPAVPFNKKIIILDVNKTFWD